MGMFDGWNMNSFLFNANPLNSTFGQALQGNYGTALNQLAGGAQNLASGTMDAYKTGLQGYFGGGAGLARNAVQSLGPSVDFDPASRQRSAMDKLARDTENAAQQQEAASKAATEKAKVDRQAAYGAPMTGFVALQTDQPGAFAPVKKGKSAYGAPLSFADALGM